MDFVLAVPGSPVCCHGHPVFIKQGQITVTYNLFLNHSLGEDGKKCLYTCLREQPTFGNTTTGFPAK